ncbi:hypothetical protein [Spirosoma litoris]
MSTAPLTNRRSFLRQLGLGALSVGLISGLDQCKGDTDSVQPFNPYTFMTNPKDSLILKVDTQAGELIEYFGTRDLEGIPKTVDVITYRSQAQNELATYCYLNAQSNVSKIISEDGAQFAFKWSSASKALVTFVSADKDQQLSTEIDFAKVSTTGSGRLAATGTVTKPQTEARSGKSIELMVSEKPLAETSFPSAARLAGQSSIMVDVKKCGFPADAEVWIRMYKTDKLNQLVKVGRFPTVRTTKGIYSCFILSDDAASKIEINHQKLCKWAIQAGICSASIELLSKGLCTALAAAGTVESGGLAAPAFTAAVAACSKGVNFVLKKVAAAGCQKVIDGTIQPVTDFCNANFADVNERLWTGNLQFIAEAVGVGPKPIYSKLVDIDGQQAYPNLSIDLGGSPSVNYLILEPSKPLAKYTYVAQASLSCLPYGTVVTLSITGTDGYQDSTSTTVTSLLSDGTFGVKLIVPGAQEAGINDVVTLVANLPNGKQLRQTASLVFV